MNYFKGSRRKVRKSASLRINSSGSVALETRNTGTGHQVADLPKVDKTQRRLRDSDITVRTQKKRSRDLEKTERTLRKRSRDSKKTESAQHNRSRDLEKTESAQHKRSRDLEKTERTLRKRSRDSEKTESAQHNRSRDLEKTERTQRKRSRDSEKIESETNITTEPKKRKAQHSTSNSDHEASRKNKSTRMATKRSESASSIVHVAAEQSCINNQPDQSGNLSTSESDGNSNLSNKRDSLIAFDTNEQQSDRNFLQQQIKTLKAPFQLEEDCPALAKIRANDPKHIPLEVIQNTLRKVNHKTEDEILRNLNRPAQRKLLSNLEGTCHEKDVLEESPCVSDQQLLERYEEIQTRVTNLEKVHGKFQYEHAQHKRIDVFVSQLEAVSEEFSGKTLIQEVKRTNTLRLGVKNELSLSNDTPITHQQLVQILFKD